MKKLAMIGCGGIGGYHLSHFLGFKDIVELSGFCDLIPERAEDFVRQAESGRAFTDFRIMLDEINPDMVFVCVPPNCHGDIEYELITRKIHFFVEKPVALSLDMARDIRDKIEEAGLITASGFQCRYSNLVEPNKKFISDHEIVFIECARIGGIPGVDWWNSRTTSGGQIVEQTIHQFDIIRYVLGEPVEVFTFGTRGFVKMDGFDTEDASVTAVKFESGAVGMISTGCYAVSGESFDSKVTFSAKDCRADLRILDSFKISGLSADQKQQESGLILSNDGSMKASSDGNSLTYHQDGDAGIICDRTFIEAVLSGDDSKIRSPYADAVKSLVFTMSCNISMDTGMPIKIDYK